MAINKLNVPGPVARAVPAEKLDAIAPFTEDARCFMTNSGTEAVEAAIKLARYHTRRPCFIGFYGAFHGRTMGALAFTASRRAHGAGFSPMLSGVTHIPYPDPYWPHLQGPQGRSVVRIAPALNITRPLVEEGLAIFERALTEAEQTTERW